MAVVSPELLVAMKRRAVDPRRCVISKITPEGLAAILSGQVRCVNFPDDGEIKGIVFDLASNSLMIRIEAAQFPVVPQFERFPDFNLLVRSVDVLVSAANP